MDKLGVNGSCQERIVIAGGTGFLGRNIAQACADHRVEVTILSRSKPADGPWMWAQWDGFSLNDWAKEIDGCDALINCAGRSIDCVPTQKNKELILRSRVESTRVLGEAIREADRAPKVWVQLSAVGIYGDTDQPRDESSPIGTGFLPEVCQIWEQAFEDACPDHVRSVILRAGVVLGYSQGAFPLLRTLSKIGLGGPVGSGNQGISWIHECDITRMILYAIANESMRGTYNAVSPNPVTNRVFMKTLRKTVGMPLALPAPAFGVRLAARYLLKTNPDLALKGQFVSSKRVPNEGFGFVHPDIDEALTDLCSGMTG